jgi:large subunit ribosomal protein L23
MTAKTVYDIIRRPLITERATDLQAMNPPQYAFAVHPEANKIEIAAAVEELFSVKVSAVNTMVRKGKMKRSRKGRPGHRPDVKRAIVTLEPGFKIDLH